MSDQQDDIKDQDTKPGQEVDQPVAGEKTPAQVSEPEQLTEDQTPTESEQAPEEATKLEEPETSAEEEAKDEEAAEPVDKAIEEALTDNTPGASWYVVHTYSGHENRVATALKQRVESEHLDDKIVDVLVPTQQKIEIRSGKKETIKEKIFPGYILVKMVLDDDSWLAVRTTQGVTSFVGMGNKPTPISESEVKSIVNFMEEGGQPTYKQIFSEGDTVKIVDGPFTEFIGKVDNVDKEKGKVRVLVSIFGRETPVELDFLQVAKL